MTRALASRASTTMANIFDALRARHWRREPPQQTRWQRIKAVLGSFWMPHRRKEVELPNWVHVLVGVSDDGLRIPGTSVRLGLDAVLGTLLPGAGDALGGVT